KQAISQKPDRRLEMILGARMMLVTVTLCTAVYGQVAVQPSPAATQDKIIVGTPEAKRLKAENAQKAKDLLQRAYSTSKELSDSDRAAVLSRLASSSSRVMPDRSKAWADEVFQITQGLSNDNSRQQYEMTAMLAVAENDLDHAMQLLMQMSLPGATDDGTPLMDLRGPAAIGLFQKYWQKRGE